MEKANPLQGSGGESVSRDRAPTRREADEAKRPENNPKTKRPCPKRSQLSQINYIGRISSLTIAL
jgi:hypothetical protein